MSRLNTMYPDDEFLKNISDMMGKLDNKNETEIKQEIEQIGYKEFYRYSKEKDIYIKQLKEEIEEYKTQQKEFIKYLEDEIEKATTNPYTKLSEYGMNRIHIYKEILQKYKKNNRSIR